MPTQQSEAPPVRMVRTPYGWDARVEDREARIPVWHEPPGRRRGRRWALFAIPPLVVLITGLAVWHPGVHFGDDSVAARITPKMPTHSQLRVYSPPTQDSTPSPSALPTDSATVVRPPVKPAEPRPVVPSSAPTTSAPASGLVKLTGSYSGAGGQSNTVCNDGATGRATCQWYISVAPGSTLDVDLNWQGDATLALSVTGLDGRAVYSQKSAFRSLRTTIPNDPGDLLFTVSVVSGQQAQFALNLALRPQ